MRTDPTAALIRTNRIGNVEIQLYNYLRQYFDDRVFIVLDNFSGSTIVPDNMAANVIKIDHALLSEIEIPYFDRIAWVCGDIFYYAALHRIGNRFDFFWLVENDVVINFDNPSDFFSGFVTASHDFLAPTLGSVGPDWYWTKAAARWLEVSEVKGCLFPITRMSAQAVQHLALKRSQQFIANRDMLLQSVEGRIPNDEAFCATVLHRDGFLCADMKNFAPEKCFSIETFHSDYPVMPEEARLESRHGRVLHPVRSGEAARWKLNAMQAKAPKLYQARKEFLVKEFGKVLWEQWSGEAMSFKAPREPNEMKSGEVKAVQEHAGVTIHVGFHKTGTTYIQGLLQRNSAKLADFYIVNQRSDNSKRLRAACQKVLAAPSPTPEALHDEIKAALAEIASEAGGKKIIITDEEMFGFIPGRHGYWKLYDKAAEIMRLMQSFFFGKDVKFFAYTRPRMKWLLSVYREAVKNHHLDLDFEQFIVKLDFDENLKDLCEAISHGQFLDHFEYSPMEADFDTTFGLGHSFLKFCGIDDELMQSLEKPNRANESVSSSVSDIFLALNRTGIPGAQLMAAKNMILEGVRLSNRR